MGRKRRKRRVIRNRLIIGGVFLLLAAVFVLLGVFRIHSLEVLGSERHSPEEIREDLIYNFRTENTLYFAWKYRHAGTDVRAPYLDSIQAKILSPGKVRLIVREKKLSGYVQYAGNNVYFDSDGEVLEITEEVYGKVPLVSGVTMEEPMLYQKLPVENTAQLRTMLSITGLLIQADLIPDNISFDENLSITLKLGDIDVKLGQDEYLEEKVANLVTIYQEIRGQSGILNMEAFTGKSEPITLRTREEENQEPETDEEGNPLETVPETDEYGNPVETVPETDEYGNPVAGSSVQTSSETDAYGNPVNSDAGSTDSGSADSGEENGDTSEEVTGVAGFMVFDSSGTLRYDARVVNGQVVDAYGNPIDGCSVEENGYVKDAYWNIIDPQTGQLAEQ